MKYNASLDTPAKILTGTIFFIFSVMIYLNVRQSSHLQNMYLLAVRLAPSLILVMIIFGAYLFSPQHYEIEEGDLKIVRQIKSRKIKVSEIKEVRRLTTKDLGSVIRTFGVGGLFGYFGKHRSSTLGKLTYYATQRKNYVLVVTEAGEKIILTPDDGSFASFLQKNSRARHSTTGIAS